MAKNTAHFLKDGSRFKGKTHKMSDGTVHTGVKHSSTSKKLFHLAELTKKAQQKAASRG